MPDDFDVIVIGTGAGGGTLAETGKRILLLERGNNPASNLARRPVPTGTVRPRSA